MYTISNVLVILLVFMFGASIGSFLSLVATRMNPNKRKLSFKEICVSPSHCDFTGKKLGIIELVPVFSYMFLRGKSHKDKKSRIPLHYFLMELICGIAAVLSFFQFMTEPYKLIILTILIFGFIYLAYYDFLYWEVQLELIIFLFLMLLIYYLVNIYIGISSFSFLIERLIATIVGIGFILFFIVISKGKGLGLGDAWIMGLMGMALGYLELFLALTIASVIGSFVGLYKAFLFEGKVKGVMIQFVPFLALGFIIVLLFGKNFSYYFTY